MAGECRSVIQLCEWPRKCTDLISEEKKKTKQNKKKPQKTGQLIKTIMAQIKEAIFNKKVTLTDVIKIFFKLFSLFKLASVYDSSFHYTAVIHLTEKQQLFWICLDKNKRKEGQRDRQPANTHRGIYTHEFR